MTANYFLDRLAPALILLPKFSMGFSGFGAVRPLRMPDFIRFSHEHGFLDAGIPAVAADAATHRKLEQ